MSIFSSGKLLRRAACPRSERPSQCRHMRDTLQCNGKAMDVLGQNKWVPESPPHIQGSWLRTTTVAESAEISSSPLQANECNIHDRNEELRLTASLSELNYQHRGMGVNKILRVLLAFQLREFQRSRSHVPKFPVETGRLFHPRAGTRVDQYCSVGSRQLRWYHSTPTSCHQSESNESRSRNCRDSGLRTGTSLSQPVERATCQLRSAPLQRRPHISFLTRIGNWMRTFGILSGVGITLALAIRFCGIGTILVKPYCACPSCKFAARIVGQLTAALPQPTLPQPTLPQSLLERITNPIVKLSSISNLLPPLPTPLQHQLLCQHPCRSRS